MARASRPSGSRRATPTSRRPRLLKLVGPSGVGKTTLAERLIARWAKRGLVVGYLKHAAHGFELDRPGKDSARAAAAGARGVCLVGPTGIAYLEAAQVDLPEDVAQRFFAWADVVLVEGFSLAGVPTIELVGPRGSLHPKPKAKGEILARIATKAPKQKTRAGGVPVLGRDDVEGIARLVDARLGIDRPAT